MYAARAACEASLEELVRAALFFMTGSNASNKAELDSRAVLKLNLANCIISKTRTASKYTKNTERGHINPQKHIPEFCRDHKIIFS